MKLRRKSAAAFSRAATSPRFPFPEPRTRPAPPSSACNQPDLLHRLGHHRKSTVHILLMAANSLWLVRTVEAGPASITNFAASRTTDGITVQFSLASASNNVPYN